MTQAVASLFEQLEKLSEAEKVEFRDAFVRHYSDDEIYGEITDEDIDAMGVESFRRLEEEENAAKARRDLGR